ncbi:MAG: hypothetical protein ACK5LR_11820 [Mangrovibacterium sp.]
MWKEELQCVLLKKKRLGEGLAMRFVKKNAGEAYRHAVLLKKTLGKHIVMRFC